MRITQGLAAAIGLSLGASFVSAETSFTANYANGRYQIESAKDDKPLIKYRGKWVVPIMETMNLSQNNPYDYQQYGCPGWAYVKKIKAEHSGINIVDEATTINTELALEFSVTAPSELKNVYVAIYLDGGSGQRGVVVREVGDLKQWGTRHVTANFRIDNRSKGFTYLVFVFSRRRELYTDFSQNDSFYRNFRRAVWDLRKDGNNESMRLLYSFLPLEARCAKGAVTAHLQVGADGSVEKVEAVTSDKKLATSIEGAVKYWWFVPPSQCGETTSMDILIHLDQWKSWSEQSVEILPGK